MTDNVRIVWDSHLEIDVIAFAKALAEIVAERIVANTRSGRGPRGVFRRYDETTIKRRQGTGLPTGLPRLTLTGRMLSTVRRRGLRKVRGGVVVRVGPARTHKEKAIAQQRLGRPWLGMTREEVQELARLAPERIELIHARPGPPKRGA